LRTVLAIHQQCYTGWKEEKTKEFQEICDRCSYEADPEFYDWFVNQTNRMYEGMKTAMAEIIQNVDHVDEICNDMVQ
jgi:succinate dehydrogenase flavin-adding protein (antitoxin of CptAB toxin-antitoxin module)